MSAPYKSSAPLVPPVELTARNQWVLWLYATRNGKPTKIPFQTSGKPADVSNPGTWTTFKNALSMWCCNKYRYAGLGFVFTKDDPFAGIDLDDSLDEQGNAKAWASGIVERFSNTYMEVSPSGLGLKIC
jgi:putative DNA primase/helicase